MVVLNDDGVCPRHRQDRRRRAAVGQHFGIRFQPSEIAKVGIIMFFSAGLSKRSGQPAPQKKWSKRTFTGRMAARLDRVGLLELLPYGAVLAVVLGVIALQHHMSAMVLVVVAAASVLFVSGISLGWFAAGGTLVVGALVWIITRRTT